MKNRKGLEFFIQGQDFFLIDQKLDFGFKGNNAEFVHCQRCKFSTDQLAIVEY